MANWQALYNTKTGRLISQGTVFVDPLPPDTALLDVGTNPGRTKMWNEATRRFVDRPPKVAKTKVEQVMDSEHIRPLNTGAKNAIAAILRNHLGDT